MALHIALGLLMGTGTFTDLLLKPCHKKQESLNRKDAKFAK